MAVAVGALVTGVYTPAAWQQQIEAAELADSPRYILLEPALEIGPEQGWEDGAAHIRLELVTRHDPTVQAIAHHMPTLRSELVEGLALWQPAEFSGREGRRRLVTEILRLSNEALRAEGVNARIEAVYVLRLDLQYDQEIGLPDADAAATALVHDPLGAPVAEHAR